MRQGKSLYLNLRDVRDPWAEGPFIDNGIQDDNRGIHSFQRVDEPPYTGAVTTDDHPRLSA